jgi:hypothetical protein
MFTRDDLIDAVLRGLKAGGTPSAAPAAGLSAAGAARAENGLRAEAASPIIARARGRLFLTEYDIKKALTPGALVLTIPSDAIISPLAQDWLALKGVVIVRSDR